MLAKLAQALKSALTQKHKTTVVAMRSIMVKSGASLVPLVKHAQAKHPAELAPLVNTHCLEIHHVPQQLLVILRLQN